MKDFESLCLKDSHKCYNESAFISDPRNYNLSEDFIFIDQEWGSMFYKFIGKMTKNTAKQICSKFGDSVHLPVPRFQDENEFYRTHFGETNLWLDITYDAEKRYRSAFGYTLTEQIHSVSAGKLGFDKYEWMNITALNSSVSHNAVMANKGHWYAANESELFDSVCIYNIIPNEKCSKCLHKDFCRFTDRTKQKTKCICPKNMEGQFCKTNTCRSHCQNRGYCQKNDQTKEMDCFCRYPFQGRKCETSKNFQLKLV